MLSIAVKSLAGDWNRVSGSEGYRHTHSVFGGPESASFALKRDTRRLHSDIGGFAPVYVSMGGAPVWSGRMAQTPTERSDQSVFQVQCEGWYRQLYGKPVDKTWIIEDFSRWTPAATFPAQDLTREIPSNVTLEINDSAMIITVPYGTICPADQHRFAMIDAGPNNTIKSMYFEWDCSTGDIGSGVYLASDSTGVLPFDDFQLVSTLNTASGTYSKTWTTARRYAFVGFYRAGSATFGHHHWLRIKKMIVVTDSADLSSGVSTLTASTVISECLGLGVTPNISTDTSGITSTSFVIPHFPADRGRLAVGDLIQRANAYHAYQFFLSRDSTPRATYRAIPTTPTWILNDKDAYKISNGGANDASEVTGEVIVQYTDASGIPAEVTVTNSNTIIGKRGDVNTKILAPSTPMTSAAATQLGTIYLNTHVLQPFKATAVLTGSITNYTTGAQTPLALLPAGDAILLGSETDPDTGARGRIGIITQVDYEHDSQTAQVTIDSPRDFLDALLERMGVAVR